MDKYNDSFLSSYTKLNLKVPRKKTKYFYLK